ncbi:MAG: GHKL domain-containing protein [Clostridiales bacterium]|nr:GHKL domain-containing protein [Clostridiales bacterium]
MLLYIWELFVCIYETLLVTYLFYKKLGAKPRRALRIVISVLLMTSALCILTFTVSSTPLRMALILAVYIFVAVWTFDCSKRSRWYKALIWPSCVLLVVAVADNVTFSIAEAMTDYPLHELMLLGGARVQFTLVYLLVVTVLVWAVVHLGEPEPELPFAISILLFIFMGIGIFAAESILDISLELKTNPATASQAAKLSSQCYFILLTLFALLITYECLGIILSKNRRLRQQQQLAKMEKQQYDLVVSTAESLRQWKHGYQGQLRLIGALIEQEKYSELKQFSTQLISDLPSAACLPFSGNHTLDAVVSLRMIDAKRHNIHFESTMFLPDYVPLSDVEFASLVGNLLDNAIEACRRAASENAEIKFEIKPWKQMMYLFCSNTSDGKYIRSHKGYLLSTKSAEGHGIGLRRIKEIVEQAGGTYQFAPEAERFSVSIMIPLEDNVNEDSDC